MCGRYANTRSDGDLKALLNAESVAGDPPGGSYNVAPTDDVRVVLERSPRGADGAEPVRQLRTVRWGLVPSWADDVKIGNRLINARVETLGSKPAWRAAFAKRRAIVPADGYYEWQAEERDGKAYKQPYFIHPADGGILCLAGLYELWPDPSRAEDDPDRWLWSCTIITTDATGPAGQIHDRTPVILPPDRVDDWLNPRLTDKDEVTRLLTGITVDDLEVRAVSTKVNKVGNDGPKLIEPLDDTAGRAYALAIA